MCLCVSAELEGNERWLQTLLDGLRRFPPPHLHTPPTRFSKPPHYTSTTPPHLGFLLLFFFYCGYPALMVRCVCVCVTVCLSVCVCVRWHSEHHMVMSPLVLCSVNAMLLAGDSWSLMMMMRMLRRSLMKM